MSATAQIQPTATETAWYITPFRMRVLKAAAKNEYTGSIEVSLTMYGYPDALEDHNVYRALNKLHDDGYFDLRDFVLTDKGRKAIGLPVDESTPDLTIQMGAEFDSPLPGETFKSVHALTPWQMGIGRNPMNTAALRRADEQEHDDE